jgi:hypothetical protein
VTHVPDIFTSGEQPVADGFYDWAGQPYNGPSLPVARSLRSSNFEAVVTQRAYCYVDYASWRSSVKALQARWGSLRGKLSGDESLLVAEDGHAAKGLVCWRRPGFGRLAFASNFRAESSAQAETLRPYLRRRGNAYIARSRELGASALKSMIERSSIPLDRGKGAPWYQSASDRGSGLLLAILGRKLRSYGDLNDALQQSTGIRNWMTMYTRVQAAGKQSSRREIIAGRVVASGWIFQPKVRTVKAPPFAENNLNAPPYETMKHVCLSIFGNIHTTDIPFVVRTLRNKKEVWATDLTTCDDTIGLQLLAAYRAEVLGPLWAEWVEMGVIERWWFDFLMTYDEHVNIRDILAPAWAIGQEAVVLSMIGGNKSGERGTTQKTIDCVGARCEAIQDAYRRRGFNVSFFSWGDDVVWYTDDSGARSIWDEMVSDADQRHLWIEKHDDDASYLMVRARTGYGYFARQMMRKLNREPREEPDDCVGAALSIRASYDKLTGPYGDEHPLKPDFLPAVAEVPALAQAATLAAKFDYNTLTRWYGDAVRHAKPERRQEFDYGLLDQDTADVAASIEEAGLVLDRRTGLELPRVATERMVRDLADRWSTDEVLKMLRRKIR